VKRRVHDRWSAYSSLAAGRHGTASAGWVYVLYEHGERGGDDGDDPRSVTPGETIARCSPSWLVRGDPTGDGDLPERVPR